MAAINKYRIVGPRYKQQTRIYKDEIFHFSSDEGPQNAIITAKNSFGKGVLLQLLFQPIIPKTSWSRGKNKVNHFFYADKGQFKPYTFYSCIDFHLDLDRHLMVGIAMTSQLNEQNDSEPLYTLFIRPYGQSLYDPFTIDNLPLYNREKEAPVSYSEFTEFLAENKKEFLIFHEHSKAKFYQALDGYGIMKKDWEQLIDINQYEGGVAYYFDDKNATTNQGLFSKMIIPAIEARLTEKGEENDLITLFKNIASITKNLPELKKNAYAYTEIKNHNEDISFNLAELMQEKEKLDIHLEKGGSIVSALTNEVSVLKKEIIDHKEQLKEFKDLETELRWKEQNLQYVVKHYEHEDVITAIQSLKIERNDTAEQELAAKSQQDTAELQLQLKKWYEKDLLLQEVLRKISAIEHSNEYRESKEKQAQLENEIQSEWNTVRKNIQEINRESETYTNHLKKLEKKISQEVEDYRQQLFDDGIDKKVIDRSINTFNEELEEQKNQYGEYFYLDLEKILVQKRHELKNQQDLHSNLLIKQNGNAAEKTLLIGESAAIETEIKAIKKDIERSKQEWERQQEKEQKIKLKVWKVLRTNPVEIEDIRNWLNTNFTILKNRKKEWEVAYNQLNIQMYELAFEVQQNGKPYLIPNEEVYKVKSQLSKRGIPVLLGDEYIKQQEPARRKEINKNHPLLKYGLIILLHNKAYLEEIKKLDNEFYHSPIPIYTADNLKQPANMSFILLDKEATELSIDEEKMQARKQELHTKSEVVKTEINKTKEFIEQLTNAAADVESFDRTFTAEEMKKEYHNQRGRLLKKEAEAIDVKNNINLIEQELLDIIERSNSAEIAIDQLSNENDNLERWVTAKPVYEDEKTQQCALSLKIQGTEKKMKAKQDDLTKVNEESDDWKEAQREWNRSIKQVKEEVREIIPKATIEILPSLNNQTHAPFLDLNAVKLKESLYKWKTIQHETANLNIELVELNVDLKHLRAAVKAEENQLYRLNNEWEKCSLPQENITALQKNLDASIKIAKEIETRILELSSDLKHGIANRDKLKKELDELKKAIHEDFDRPSEIWVREDFSMLKNEIRHAIARNTEDIKDTKDILKHLELKKLKYEMNSGNLSVILSTLNITADVLPSSFIQDAVKKDSEKMVEEWIQIYKNYKNNMDREKSKLQVAHRKKKEVFERSDWALEIKDMVLKVYSDMDFEELEEVKASIASLDLLARTEIAEAEDEKNTAEDAKKEWVEHACKYALQIIEHLRKMIKAMQITNRNKLTFPLVKLKRENLLPKETEQIRGNIEDLFDRIITEVFADYQDLKDIPQKVLKDKISVNNIVLAAFNYQYPVLRLYRLHEENSFLYEPPKEEFYTEWETINESSKTDPSGSGGQLFGARTLILMMLISFKRRNDDNSNWKLLITDNPFSVAVSDHIVDPILAIAEELKFQWIVVTPPELVKIELLKKFDMYYQLSSKAINSGTDQVVSEVQYGYRNYKKTNSILKEDIKIGY